MKSTKKASKKPAKKVIRKTVKAKATTKTGSAAEAFAKLPATPRTQRASILDDMEEDAPEVDSKPVNPRQTKPEAWCLLHEISNFEGREIVAKYAAQGVPPLSPQAQATILAKCDPNHVKYDKLFAEITMKEATFKPEAARPKFVPFKVELEDGYDPQVILDPATREEFRLIADSPGYSLYQSAVGRDLRIVNAKTRLCNEWYRNGGEPNDPLDAKQWEFIK
jgi:hypothetical protein